MRVAFDAELLRRGKWRVLPMYVRGAYLQMLMLCCAQPEPPLIALSDEAIREGIGYDDTDIDAVIDTLVAAQVVQRVEGGVVMTTFSRYRLGGFKKKADPTTPVPVTPQVTAALEELKKVEGYPFDYETDSRFLFRMIDTFPSIDMVNEIGRWGAYKFDHPLQPNSSPRSQLRTWLQNQLRYQVRDTDRRAKASLQHANVEPEVFQERLRRAREQYGLG